LLTSKAKRAVVAQVLLWGQHRLFRVLVLVLDYDRLRRMPGQELTVPEVLMRRALLLHHRLLQRWVHPLDWEEYLLGECLNYGLLEGVSILEVYPLTITYEIN
jgi:hypothetical protein